MAWYVELVVGMIRKEFRIINFLDEARSRLLLIRTSLRLPSFIYAETSNKLDLIRGGIKMKPYPQIRKDKFDHLIINIKQKGKTRRQIVNTH